LAVGRAVLINNQVNIWPEIEAQQVGLVDEDTAPGTENLLGRWLNMPTAEREAMTARARQCFLQRFEVSRAAIAINTVFVSPLMNGLMHDRATTETSSD